MTKYMVYAENKRTGYVGDIDCIEASDKSEAETKYYNGHPDAGFDGDKCVVTPVRYVVSAISGPFGEQVGVPYYETNPEEAIYQWCKLSEKYPTCVSLQPKSKRDGKKLLKWAVLNWDKLEAWLKQYHVPYKAEWFKTQLETQVKNDKVSMEWDYDEIFPFCIG